MCVSPFHFSFGVLSLEIDVAGCSFYFVDLLSPAE
jgi:hypothetical protein